jgi:nucleotide-binding universal stress UspA family protein
MYSDLITGFDGSPSGRDALALTRRLAVASGAHPTVVTVYSSAARSADVVTYGEHGNSLARAEALLEEARKALKDIPGATFTAVSETSVARALHRVADDVDAALVVLGSTHRSALGRVLPGTTAEAILRAVPVAVAIAPAGFAEHADTHFGVVTAAVDGGGDTERVARMAGQIARCSETTLHLVTVLDRPFTAGATHAGGLGYATLRDAVREAATDTLERAAQAAGDDIETERHVHEGAVVDELARRSAESDLLVIGSRRFGPLRRIVLGRVTGGILHAATCPVLVIPLHTAEERDDAVVPMAEAGVR